MLVDTATIFNIGNIRGRGGVGGMVLASINCTIWD